MVDSALLVPLKLLLFYCVVKPFPFAGGVSLPP